MKKRSPTAAQKAECRKLLRQLSDFLDGELTRAACAKIKRHAQLCRRCQDFIASLRTTVRLCRQTGAPQLSAATKQKLRRAIVRLAARAPRST